MGWLLTGAAIVASLGLAGAAIHRHKFGGTKPVARWWLLLVGVFLVEALIGDGGWMGNLLWVWRDAAIALLVGGVYRHLEGAPAKVPFLLGVALIGGWYYATEPDPAAKSEDDAPPGQTKVARSELLLELGPDDTLSEVQGILDKYEATAERAFPTVDLSEDEDLAQYYIVRCATGRMGALIPELLKDRENVDSAQENGEMGVVPTIEAPRRRRRLRTATNDPRLGEQWALEQAQGLDALKWLKRRKPKRRALVAILDTGVDATHEDLVAAFMDSPGKVDRHGHGTHCAGIAGAVANNSIGMASLNWMGRFVRVQGFNALSPEGRGTHEQIAQSMIDAVEAGADVLSMSLGGPGPPPKVIVDAVEFALAQDRIVVVAAGNSRRPATGYSPASAPGVIVVTAIDEDGNPAKFTNTTEGLDMPIAAPGVGILSLTPGGGYEPKSGTSMATPLVAGLIGVMRSLKPKLTTSDVYKILEETADDHAAAAKIGRRVNAAAALKAL